MKTIFSISTVTDETLRGTKTSFFMHTMNIQSLLKYILKH